MQALTMLMAPTLPRVVPDESPCLPRTSPSSPFGGARPDASCKAGHDTKLEATMVFQVVGWLGLGNMGRPMATRVSNAGNEVLAFDVAGTAERLPSGATAASSIEAVLTGSDIVLMSLPDGSASRKVTDAISACQNRRVRAVIDLSTIGPVAAQEAQAALEPLGVTYADGPVSGGTNGAHAGTVSLMFAGPLALHDEVLPILEAISSNVFHVGDEPGQGQAMKLLNNFLSATALAATSEALSFGVSYGLELQAMVDILNVSSGRNSATDDKFPNRVIPQTYDSGFATSLMSKDVNLMAAETAHAGTPSDLVDQVRRIWTDMDGLVPDSDFTEIWRYRSGHD